MLEATMADEVGTGSGHNLAGSRLYVIFCVVFCTFATMRCAANAKGRFTPPADSIATKQIKVMPPILRVSDRPRSKVDPRRRGPP